VAKAGDRVLQAECVGLDESGRGAAHDCGQAGLLVENKPTKLPAGTGLDFVRTEGITGVDVGMACGAALPTPVDEDAAFATRAGEDLIEVGRMPHEAIPRAGVGETGKKNFVRSKAFYLTCADQAFASGFSERVDFAKLILIKVHGGRKRV